MYPKNISVLQKKKIKSSESVLIKVFKLSDKLFINLFQLSSLKLA
jgi:hypothetical protein